jgi:hypothetical protein
MAMAKHARSESMPESMGAVCWRGNTGSAHAPSNYLGKGCRIQERTVWSTQSQEYFGLGRFRASMLQVIKQAFAHLIG